MTIDWHSLPPQQEPAHIPVLTPDAHHAVDWDRVRATIRRLRPLRALAVTAVGLYPAVMWCNRIAGPLAAERGVHTAFAAGAITTVVCAVGVASGGGLRRWIAGLGLVGAMGGTLLADPTRHLVVTWIVGA
ncbi:hypothetical protein [Streptomyces katrae]|uniref:Uncharacterized protein n=1 Tax=Streptomyces katrae TaxID=68223 RepID=A0A0F4JTJ1_9ACTN|nr:hypothetical protein [Streptomyces katrae]KJY37149.1 hypothetical protein VR44_06405 [Streptomyces katrae]